MRDGSGTEDGRDAVRRRIRWGLGLIGLPIAATMVVGVPGAAAPAMMAQQVEPVATPGSSPVETFLAAGYTYDDALALAQRWGPASELEVKVEAGELLAQGTALTDSRFADPSAAEGMTPEDLAAAFTAAGYDGDDAAVLARAWGTDTAAAAERAGRELVVSGALPFVDLPFLDTPPGSGVGQEPAFEAYFAAGYDYDDAVLLAEHWGLAGFAEAKAQAGALLLTGEPLPDVPGVAAS